MPPIHINICINVRSGTGDCRGNVTLPYIAPEGSDLLGARLTTEKRHMNLIDKNKLPYIVLEGSELLGARLTAEQKIPNSTEGHKQSVESCCLYLRS